MKTITHFKHYLLTGLLALPLLVSAPVNAQTTVSSGTGVLTATSGLDFSGAAKLSRPTLVILIHGGTARPEADPMPWEPIGRDKRPGTIGYSRFYFDFPFVARLLGATTSVFTMQGGNQSRLTSTTWKTTLIDGNRANQFAFPRDPAPFRGRYAGLAVALVRSNGSQSIGGQSKEVLDEIRNLVASFQSFAGRVPYVVLVGHSKGGLVSRYLMSIPDGSSAGHNLSAADRTFLRSLRDKTKYCITIGSPHTGSPLADYATDFRTSAITAMQNVVNAVWTASRAAAGLVRITLPATPPVNVNSGVTQLIGDPADLGNLTTEFWAAMNNGDLHPSRMVRSDGSMIPFYLYGGRTPGDAFYSLARFDGAGGPSAQIVADANHPEHVGVMMTTSLMGLDYMLHNLAEGDWGRILTVGSNKNLDIVRRSYPIWGLPRSRMSNPGERLFPFGKEGAPIYFLRNTGDRETDSDGLVGIDSAMGIGLFTGPVTIEAMQALRIALPQGILEPWDHTLNVAPSGQPFKGGAWYRRYSGTWNFQNHSTLTKRAELGTEINRVLRAAGPYARTTGTLSVW